MIVHLLIFILLNRSCLRGHRIFTPSYPGEKSCSSESRRVSHSSSAGKSVRSGCGLGLGFLSYAEIGSTGLSPSLCNGNSFCTVQCSHQVLNPSPAMKLGQNSIPLSDWFRGKRAFSEPVTSVHVASPLATKILLR